MYKIGCLIAVLFCAAIAKSDEVRVDDFGAVGNGIGFDDAAIKAAIAAAGQNGTVIFTAGKTYNVQSRLVPLNGQTWRGNGATLRRANELKTLLSQNAQAGNNFVYVSDPSTFTLGMTISPVSGAGGPLNLEHAGNFAITQIIGNKLVLARALTKSYAAGVPVVNYFDQVGGYTGSDDMEIQNLYFDGNRSENDTLVVWSRNRAVATNSHARIIGNIFANLPGDGIAALGEDLLIEQNLFRNGNTSGIHLSGNFFDEDVVLWQNALFKMNEQADRAGHSEGAITFSQAVNHLRLLQNLVFDTDTAFSGAFQGDMGDWTIQHNQVAQTQRLFHGAPSSMNPLHDIHWLDNWAQDVGDSYLFASGSGVPIQNFIFTGNHILDGNIDLSNLEDSLISGNYISSSGETTLAVTNSFSTVVNDNQLVSYFSNGHAVDGVMLKYNRLTGDVALRGRFSSFALVTDGRTLALDVGALIAPFDVYSYNTLALPFAIAQWDVDLTGLSGEFQLGRILPAELTEQQLSELLLVHRYVNNEQSYGNLGLLAIPEPNSLFLIVLAVLGFIVVAYRKRLNEEGLLFNPRSGCLSEWSMPNQPNAGQRLRRLNEERSLRQ